MSLDRYKGKPLLRLLECYVLNSVGLLSDSDRERLAALEPKLSNVYGVAGSWDEIIASAMKFPPDLQDLIRQTWRRSERIAIERGMALNPQQFAERFVDENFI